jgi:integrase
MSAPKKRVRPATVAEVNAMKSPGRHSVGDSLILSVTSAGSRSWIARVRDPSGRRRDIGLGPMADLTLAEAREKARVLRKAGRDGEVVLTRAEKRKAARPIPSFKEAALRVHKERQEVWSNGKHQTQWLTTLETYVFPKMGDLAVDQISAGHVVEVLSPIWRSIPETARRVRQRIAAVVDWAHAREFRTTQIPMKAVTAGLGPQAEGRGNFAALPYVELATLVAKLRETETIGNLALLFTIFTAARSGEVRGAEWREIDLEAAIWTIPGMRMKAGREHVIPLSPAAVAIVERLAEIRSHKTLVFPGRRKGVLSDATMAKALRTAGVPSSRGTVHGMRSAFRDWVSEETSFPSDVAEAALAHVIRNKVEAAYRRGNLLAKRREMMAAWARYCEGHGASVVQMAAA